MNSLKLKIPVRDNSSSVNVNPNVSHIKRILEGLPLANPGECCLKITKLVYQLNRAPIDVKIRIKVMALILPLFQDVINSLRNNYINANLPLSEKRQQLALASRRLLVEMSHAYKIIVMDMVEKKTSDTSFLPQAIYCAMNCLSRLLLDSYALYAVEPRQTWLEINQLYLFSEANRHHETKLVPFSPKHEPHPATIINTYKRIVLLALANPYHLMQGEVTKMYYLLKDWCTKIDIVSLSTPKLPEGKLFIDLAVDAPPMYAPKTQNGLQAIEPRLLEITGLMSMLENEIRGLAIESRGNPTLNNLGRRMERDMYFRWEEAWGLRRERMSHRKTRQAPAKLLSGLTGAHHYISGGKPFTPEEDEVRLRGNKTSTRNTYSLSLVPEEHQPWLQTDATSQRVLPTHRTSQFDASTNTSDKDLWVKVFTTSDAALDGFADKPDNEDAPKACEVRNANQGGFGLYCPQESGFPARVGELIATLTDDNPNVWALGTVRWMKINDKQCFEMGIKLLSEDATAVATKAIQGIGKGSEYYRGLLLPDMDPTAYPTTLITPAAVYDVGTVLLMAMKKQLIYVKLTRQLDSSSAFSHYQFDIVAPPEEARSQADNQRDDVVSRNLFR